MTKYVIGQDTLTDIADSIRSAHNTTSGLINVSDYADKIRCTPINGYSLDRSILLPSSVLSVTPASGVNVFVIKTTAANSSVTIQTSNYDVEDHYTPDRYSIGNTSTCSTNIPGVANPEFASAGLYYLSIIFKSDSSIMNVREYGDYDFGGYYPSGKVLAWWPQDINWIKWSINPYGSAFGGLYCSSNVIIIRASMTTVCLKRYIHCTYIMQGTAVKALDAVPSTFCGAVIVPDELYEQYKTATNWNMMTNFIYPLSKWEGVTTE